MLVGNLRNVNKSVNSRNNAGKRTVTRYADNLNRNNVSYVIIGKEYRPWIVLSLLIAERNFLLLRVKRLDINIDNIADGNNLGRILDALPGKLGNVNHSVNAADIDERAVACKRLDDAGETVADGKS